MESAENDPQASSAATEASGAIERSPTNFQARLRRMVTTVLILVVTVGLVRFSRVLGDRSTLEPHTPLRAGRS
eukprot:SAG11_NODE_4407_length_1909_cov_1.539779_2_plen_73_part_00